MPRLVIISNRLPITIKKRAGELNYFPSDGGLATGLNSLDKKIERIWIGWPGREIKREEEKAKVQATLGEQGLVPVFLTQKEIRLFYEGFSNKTIWPHFHYFPQYTTFNDQYWEAYQEANKKFLSVVAEQLLEDDLVFSNLSSIYLSISSHKLTEYSITTT